jgi:hypothetical protein
MHPGATESLLATSLTQGTATLERKPTMPSVEWARRRHCSEILKFECTRTCRGSGAPSERVTSSVILQSGCPQSTSAVLGCLQSRAASGALVLSSTRRWAAQTVPVRSGVAGTKMQTRVTSAGSHDPRLSQATSASKQIGSRLEAADGASRMIKIRARKSAGDALATKPDIAPSQLVISSVDRSGRRRA